MEQKLLPQITQTKVSEIIELVFDIIFQIIKFCVENNIRLPFPKQKLLSPPKQMKLLPQWTETTRSKTLMEYYHSHNPILKQRCVSMEWDVCNNEVILKDNLGNEIKGKLI